MQNKKLPKTYKGYQTEELLKMYDLRKNNKSLKGYPREKILAMGMLVREYKIAPVFQF